MENILFSKDNPSIFEDRNLVGFTKGKRTCGRDKPQSEFWREERQDKKEIF